MRRAVAILEESGGLRTTELGHALVDLANLYRELNRPDESDWTSQRAEEVLSYTLGPRDPLVGMVLYNRAMRVLDECDDVRAEPLLHEAGARWLTAYGPEHAWSGWALGQLAALDRRQGWPVRLVDQMRRARAFLAAEVAAGSAGGFQNERLNDLDALVDLSVGLGDLPGAEHWLVAKIAALEGGERLIGVPARQPAQLRSALNRQAALLDGMGRGGEAAAVRARVNAAAAES